MAASELAVSSGLDASHVRHLLPPGPSTPPLLLTLRFARQPRALLDDCAARWRECFTLRLMWGRTTVLFSNPGAVREIYQADGDGLHAGAVMRDILGPLLGEHSLLMLDGPTHLRERRLMTPPLHGERMQAYGELMRDITERVLDRWPIGRPFPIHHEMQAITLDVIMRAVFGVDEGPRLDALRERIVEFLALADSPSAAFLLIPYARLELGGLTPWGRFVRRRAAVDELLFAEIAQRRAAGTAGRTDILSLLLDARDDAGRGLNDRELRDEMFTLLMAGHETTATSLAWVFHALLQRPDVLERVHAELDAVVGDGPLAPEHVSRLLYLDAVVKETARLTPVAPFTSRLLTRPARIGGHDLPAGVAVAPCIYLTHRRPDVWPDPLRFDPDRFVEGRPAPYTFFPFGGGVRRCIGAAFASYEMKVVLATVLRRLALRIAPGYRLRVVRRAVTDAPSEGMPVVVTARRAS